MQNTFRSVILLAIIGFSFLIQGCDLLKPTTEEKSYDKYDFDPYSLRRDPYRGQLLGFYIMGNKQIEHRSMVYGQTFTHLTWNIVSIGDAHYIVIQTQMDFDSYDPIGVQKIWIAFPYIDIEIGCKYSSCLEGSAITIITPEDNFQGVPFVDAFETFYPNMAQRTIPITSVAVEYELINETQIQGSFTADAELNLEDGIRMITLDSGVFRLLKNRDGYNTRYTYDDWLNNERGDWRNW